MKYVNTEVVFREVPNEITLAINISNCPFHCIHCHSKYLWDDIGEVVTNDVLKELITKNEGISCVCFMGGEIEDVIDCVKFINSEFPNLHTAWYTGNIVFPKHKDYRLLDYIKLGPYIDCLGGLDNPETNQRFYVKGSLLHKMDANDNMFYDRTVWFWNDDNDTEETGMDAES